jgi:hypothetical protein
MASEVALNVPFDSNEVKEIAVAEFRKRLDGLSPLTGGKEYASFTLDFQVTIKLRRAGESAVDGKETLAWGNLVGGAGVPDVEATNISSFASQDPNEERVSRDMPLTVESGDGRGGKIRRKVKVKGK